MPPPVREVDDAKPGRVPVDVDDANADAGPARASSARSPAAGPAFARGKVHSRNLSLDGVAGIESASLLLQKSSRAELGSICRRVRDDDMLARARKTWLSRELLVQCGRFGAEKRGASMEVSSRKSRERTERASNKGAAARARFDRQDARARSSSAAGSLDHGQRGRVRKSVHGQTRGALSVECSPRRVKISRRDTITRCIELA